MATAAVIDVGSNTVRLLVARWDPPALVTVHTERVRLRLGREIEKTGCVSGSSIEELADVTHRLASRASSHGARSLDVVITSPGRQADNGAELADAIEDEIDAEVRIVSKEEEARLAFAGALALAAPTELPVAVVDLGGASTEVAVGFPETGPAWCRSIDIGALSLTTRSFGDGRPSAPDVEAARAVVAEAFCELAPPSPRVTLAVGGSARALGRVLGPRLGAGELAAATSLLPVVRPAMLARCFEVSKRRARLLVSTALILEEVRSRLATPLYVAGGGVREGAVLLAAGEDAAAA